MDISFQKGRISRPFEQLMSVLPAASRHALPEVFHPLMLEEDSSIIDFYPEDFEVDLNGKKMAWQGVALLPFIEMPRLLAAVQGKYPLLSPEDKARNEVGRDVLIFSDNHESLYDDVSTKFYSKRQGEPTFHLDPKKSEGLSGKVEKQEGYVPHGELKYPLERRSMPDLDYDHSVSILYDFPQTSQTHKSMLLRGVNLPKPALTHSDIEVIRGKANRGGRSYGGAPLGRGGHGRGMHYGPGMSAPRGGHYGQHNNGYGPPPHGSIPPPPGGPGFGIGVPPPPPPAGHYYNNNNNRHQEYNRGGYQGYNQQRGPPPSQGAYQGQPYQGQSYQGRGNYSNHRGRGSGNNYRDNRSYR